MGSNNHVKVKTKQPSVYYCSPTKLREGNVFSHVCLSVRLPTGEGSLCKPHHGPVQTCSLEVHKHTPLPTHKPKLSPYLSKRVHADLAPPPDIGTSQSPSSPLPVTCSNLFTMHLLASGRLAFHSSVRRI